MALAAAAGGSAERALLGETALGEDAVTDAALMLDPTGGTAVSSTVAATPAPLPTSAVLDEEAMLADLLELRQTESPIPAYLAYLSEHATDAPAYLWFLRAAYRAELLESLADCPLDLEVAKQGATALAETFGPFVLSLALELPGAVAPGTSIELLLSSNPGIATNSRALVLGIFQGIAESKIASAETVYQLLEANAALTAVLPVHAVCFIAGTIYRLLREVYDTVAAIVAVVGYADEIIPFVCRLLAALPVALGRLLDVESASDVALLGRCVGQMLASSLEQYVPQLHSASTYQQIALELVQFSFQCGTLFGPLLLDIVLMFAGIGFVEASIKLLGKAVSYTSDVESIFAFLRRLLDAVDPGLFDELIAFGGKLPGRLDARLGELADQASSAYGFTKESIENGLKVLEDALGTDRYRAYTSTIFCTLEP